MIVDDARLAEIAELDEGSLADLPYAVVLCALARSRRSCTLEITRGPLAKQILFENGAPNECRSNLVTETLSRFMLKLGRLDEATATTCFNQACSDGVRFGDVLIERGLISAEELIKILQQNLAHKLLDGFSWREGSFRLFELEGDDGDSSLKVNVPQLIVIGVTRFATQAQIDGSIGHLIGKVLTLHPNPFFSRGEIKLGARNEILVESLATRDMRIDELAAATKMPYQDLTRHLYALSLIGLVVRADEVAPPPTVTAVAADPDPAAPTVRIGPSVRDREELMRLALNHRRMDAFELLQVGENATSERIEERFMGFAERFAPWQYDAELGESARQVFLAGVRAYTILMDPARCRAASERRSGGTTQQPAADRRTAAAQFRLETKLLDPDVQFNKGRELMAQGEYRKAIGQLEYAADLDAQNSVYRAELAYCRFLGDPPGAARTSLDALERALRIDPRCGLAMFYSGQILRRQGRRDEAAAMFQRAIKPMTPDRRPIDALRELQSESR